MSEEPPTKENGGDRNQNAAPEVATPVADPPETHNNSGKNGQATSTRYDWFKNFFNDPNRVIATFTGSLVIIGLIALCITRDTEKRQLRAYIGLETIEFETPHLRDLTYKMAPDSNGITLFEDFLRPRIHNYGVTPASNVNIEVYAAVMKPLFAVIPRDFAYEEPPIPRGGSFSPFISKPVISPGEKVTFDAAIQITGLSILRDAEDKKISLYFYGHISYDDIFGSHWRHEFCWLYEPWRPEGSRFIPYENHNGEKEE